MDRVFIETFGCQMNVADSERAATVLRAAGYEMADSAEVADVVLLNTCSVRARAEQKVFQRVGEIRHARAQAPISAACVAHSKASDLRPQPTVCGPRDRGHDRLPLHRALQKARRAP